MNSRNGYRRREWDTRAGTVELAIPKLVGEPGQGGHLGTGEKLAGHRNSLALERCLRRRTSRFIPHRGPAAGDGSPARRRLAPSTQGGSVVSGMDFTAEAGPRLAWRWSHHVGWRGLPGSRCARGCVQGWPLTRGGVEDSVPDIPDGLVQLVHGVADLAVRGVIAH